MNRMDRLMGNELATKADVTMKDVVLSWIGQNKKYATNNLKQHKDVFDILFYLLLEEFIEKASEEDLEAMVDSVCVRYQKSTICEVTIEQFKNIIMKNKEKLL